MSHPTIDNPTAFAFEALFLADEEARPILVTVLKGTYDVGQGVARPAEEPAPVLLAGEWWGEPGISSLRFEPEIAPAKPRVDVVLVGHAWASRSGVRAMAVTLRCGSWEKRLRVIGDRTWSKRLGHATSSDPEPFESIPLIYERAFGGWDRSPDDPIRHSFEPRNPVGTSFRAKGGHWTEGIRLPNVEDQAQPLKRFGDAPPPGGFGFVAPDWTPRAGLAGSYDDAWRKTRMPRLPSDFDPRYFNGAPADQQLESLHGDEIVEVLGATPAGRLSFALPGEAAPACLVERSAGDDETMQTRLDTVIVDADHERLYLLWRARLVLQEGPHEVRTIAVTGGSTVGR